MFTRKTKRRLRKRGYFLFSQPGSWGWLSFSRRKAFFLLSVLLFLGLGFFVFHFYPDSPENITIFFALFFLAVMNLAQAVFLNLLRSFFAGLFLTAALALRCLAIATPLNLFLLLGTVIVVWLLAESRT